MLVSLTSQLRWTMPLQSSRVSKVVVALFLLAAGWLACSSSSREASISTGGTSAGSGGRSEAASSHAVGGSGGSSSTPSSTGSGGTSTTGGTGTQVGTRSSGGRAETGGSSSSGGGTTTGGRSLTGGSNSGGVSATGDSLLGGAGTTASAGGRGGTTSSGGGFATGGTTDGSVGGTSTTGGSTASTGASTAGKLKPRVVALTDIGPDSVEPDDSESLIRLFAHADILEIEGIYAGSGYNTSNYPASWADRIGSTIDAYEKDLPNLMKRSGQTGFQSDESKQQMGTWPSAAYLRSRKGLGCARSGANVLGTSNDSDGSKALIILGDEADDRPIWITVWGGGNTFAQTLWRVKNDRTPEQFKAFVRKFRVYTITDQDKPMNTTQYADSSHQWMRKNAGSDLMFLWDECAWLDHNTWGVNHWSDYASNIQGHGNLGAIYSKYRWGVEGDTPSFLHVMPNGLNDAEAPGQGGWGGIFAYGQTVDGQTSAWVNEKGTINAACKKYNSAFFQAAFNNFVARMDWAKEGKGNRNPVVVINDSDGQEVITLKPSPGDSVTLDASKTTDPDGDKLSFKWWVFTEAGTYTPSVAIPTSTANKVTISVPADSAGKSIHVICEVSDAGAPALTSYRRIILQPGG
jgi:hypothetical protein